MPEALTKDEKDTSENLLVDEVEVSDKLELVESGLGGLLDQFLPRGLARVVASPELSSCL